MESSSEDSQKKAEPENIIYLPKLQLEEAEFLLLVSEDDVMKLQTYLREHSNVNINCANFQGITALQIAVRNRSEEMVEFLLQRPNIEIGDTVLHSVRDSNIKILEMLLEGQKKISPGLEFAGTCHSAEFPGHLTPLTLAAQLNNYEVVSFLIARGHTISRPHLPTCICKKCKNSYINTDLLYATSARLSAYRAMSSPAYMVHVSSDPILSAFRLTAELAANADLHIQLAAAYLQLRDDVRAFAVDLLGCCRTSEEVELILKQTSGSLGRSHFVLPRLLMAVDYKQKEFVAHPNTQQVLESHWIGDWYSWRHMSSFIKAFIIMCRVFITPFILLLCIIAPQHRLVRHWRIPLNKLITHAAAYFVFLALVFYISNQDKSKLKRGPPNTGAEFPLFLYVCGYTWSAIRMCLMQGPRRFFSEMWNWAEVIMLGLFGVTFALWVFAACEVAANNKQNIERKYWNQYDPVLLAEGTFCLATIFAYCRLMLFCQLNYHLGPLQVSLGKMTIDIYKYIIVFTIIISAFAAGLARFYQYYDGMVYEDEFGMKTVQVSSFTSLTDTLNTLFWALFCMAPLESADVVLENTRGGRHVDRIYEYRHGYTERIGYFCFGCFEVISVIVVLNMLIATMSNTFQRVTDNVAIEWTFGRTQVYVDYMWQTTLPSPYNMIPTATGVLCAHEWLRARMQKCYSSGTLACCSMLYMIQNRLRQYTDEYMRLALRLAALSLAGFLVSQLKDAASFNTVKERDIEASIQKEYPALMSVLVQRYFKSKQRPTADFSVDKQLESIHREVHSMKDTLDKKTEEGSIQ